MSGRAWVAAILVFAACGGGTSTPTSTTAGPTSTTPSTTTTAADDEVTVTSDDGSAVLVFNRATLPAGIGLESIELRRIDPADRAGDSAAIAAIFDSELEPGPSYELLPDGLVFAEPALLVLEGDHPALLTGFLIGENVESLHGTVAGGEAGFVIPHFSVVVTAFGPYQMTLATPNDWPAGGVFSAWSYVVHRLDPADPLFTEFALEGHVRTTGLSPGSAVFPAAQIVPGTTDFDVLDLTCGDPGDAIIDYAVAVTVEPPPEGVLDGILDLLVGENDPELIWIGSVQASVACLGDGDPAAAAGIYSGTVQVAEVPGTSGGSYDAQVQLLLDRCYGARIVQAGTQVSLGRYLVATLDETGLPVTILIRTRGEGEGYREGYVLRADLDEGTIAVLGLNAGGGHGFGDPPPDSHFELVEQSVFEWLGGDDPYSKVPGPLIELFAEGWFGVVSGDLERTGDAPPCE